MEESMANSTPNSTGYQIPKPKGTWYPEDNNKITLRGDGIMFVFPDLAVIRLGLVSEGESLAQLQSENAAITNIIIGALEQIGVDDISTFSFSVDKNYIYENGRRIDRGYIIRNILEIRTFDMENVGVIIDTAVANGANQVDLVSFQVSTPSEYYGEALNLAIMDGIEKARNISETFGFNIHPIPISIVEHGTSQEAPMPFSLAREADAATPVLPGEQRIAAGVTMEFEMV